jgi:hypothetical protein
MHDKGAGQVSAIDERDTQVLVIACEQEFIRFEESLKDLGHVSLSWQIDWILFRLDITSALDKQSSYPGLFQDLQDVV